tara:strand:- start:800 stop:2446 length:1647 start_codon:yes stop_codon:yes gene_type:complete
MWSPAGAAGCATITQQPEAGASQRPADSRQQPLLAPAMVSSDPLEDLLDGPLHEFSSKRLLILLLVACSWTGALPIFIDEFIAQAVDLEQCTCSNTSDLIGADDVCSSCSAAGGELQCPSVPYSMSAEWGLYCSRDWQRGIGSSFLFAGLGVGSLITGVLSDRLGRHRVLFVSTVLVAVFFAASAGMPTFELYLGCRTLLGMGLAGMSVVGLTLACELVGPTTRIFATIALPCYIWAFVSCITPGIAYAFRDHSWRVLILCCSAFYLVQAACVGLLLPESPQWLLRQGEATACQDVVRLLVGHVESTDERLIAIERQALSRASDERTLLPENGLAAPNAGVVEGEAKAGGSQLGQLCSDRRMRRICLVQIFLWMVISLSYYAISFNAGNLSSSIYLNFFLISLPVFPAAYSTRLLDSPRLGRRGANAIFLGLIAVAITLGAIFPVVATGSSMVGTFAAEAAFNLIYVQVQELFPTSVRNSALGMCSAASRVATLLAGPLPILLGSTSMLMLIGVLAAVALPLSWFALPETLGVTLANVGTTTRDAAEG